MHKKSMSSNTSTRESIWNLISGFQTWVCALNSRYADLNTFFHYFIFYFMFIFVLVIFFIINSFQVGLVSLRLLLVQHVNTGEDKAKRQYHSKYLSFFLIWMLSSFYLFIFRITRHLIINNIRNKQSCRRTASTC